MSVPVYIALLHHPVTNRHGEVVTTSVTNLDLHDISRSARTYGIRQYFVVTPIEDQHQMVGRILKHWTSELSRQWHPDRVEAVSRIRLVRDFAAVKEAIMKEITAKETQTHGLEPEVILTDARTRPNAVTYGDLRRELNRPERTRPAVIVFGTGWGVAETFFSEVHQVLEPIHGVCGKQGDPAYNHLSVRAAAAIILDRLFGSKT